MFTTNTPVVTAIGHTDDQLIADQVADIATITPTAAGESIVNSRQEFLRVRSSRWSNSLTPRTRPSSRSTNTNRNSPKQSMRRPHPRGSYRFTTRSPS
ncbi:exodeoxyribonuclease VII large subunit [Halorientalis persicus]|uniref:exodeoxyribonuclease VII large subunit n=1 Tax=Halorientalis persicus TaxID=1367881 RepID=UPI00244E96B6|nr:exodeoxyribonuclease VII large subunit [Halorientalis persicus]